MEKQKKEKLKTRNPYAYYRNGYWACKSCKWLSIFTPFIVLFAVNFDKYFPQDMGNGTTVKMSIGCVLACLVGGIAFWNESRKKSDGTKGSSPISGVIAWAIVFAFCYLFQSILNDLTMIVGCALIGQLAGLGFEFGAENRAFYMNEYKNARIHTQALSEANKQALKNITGKDIQPYE